MTELSAPPLTLAVPDDRTRCPADRPEIVAGLAVLGLSVLVALVLVTALEQTTVSVPLALAAGLGLIGFVALALTRLDAAVVVAVGLGAVVFVEPAPTDAAFLLILSVAAVTGRLRLGRAPGSIKLFLGALLTLNLISMVEAVDVPLALRYVFITLYLTVTALWLATWVDTERRARLFVLAWLWVALASALIGVLALYLPFPFREVVLSNGETRARAFFKDSNVYGPFLVPIAVIVLDQRIRPRILHLSSWWSTVALILLTLGVLFSYSRAGWLNFLLAVGVTLFAASLTRRGGARAARTLVGLLVVAAMSFFVLGATGQLEFVEQRAQVQAYDTDRFGAQRAGYELGWTHPVGVGPGQFASYNEVETHSTFVRVLAEQGFGGLIAWLALAFSTLVLAVRNTVRGTHTFGIGAPALLGAWCGLLLNSVVVDTLHWRHLWLVAALIWAGAMRERLVAPAAQRTASSGRSPSASRVAPRVAA